MLHNMLAAGKKTIVGPLWTRAHIAAILSIQGETLCKFTPRFGIILVELLLISCINLALGQTIALSVLHKFPRKTSNHCYIFTTKGYVSNRRLALTF